MTNFRGHIFLFSYLQLQESSKNVDAAEYERMRDELQHIKVGIAASFH